MQRWIAAASVALMLMFGGAWYGYRVYMSNRPHPVWVPFDDQVSDQTIRELKTKLSDHAILTKISRDLGLPQKWNLATDELCALELEQRLFVKAGDKDTPRGKLPAILVGVDGKEKESALTTMIALRLAQYAAVFLGNKLPPKNAD